MNNSARRAPNHHRYEDNTPSRLRGGPRSMSNLATPLNKSGDRRNGRFNLSSSSRGGGGSGGGGGRRGGKFEDQRSHSNNSNSRGTRPGGVTSQHQSGSSGGVAGGSGSGNNSSRVRNGWGAQFKEFGEREKEKEKKEEGWFPFGSIFFTFWMDDVS